jgi:hypothetical protein
MRAPTAVTNIPLAFKTRGGQSLMILPDGTRAVAQREATIDNAMVKLIARAFRWQRLINDGVYATIEEIAEAENIGASYISRVMRLVNLAPEIVEAILNGKQSPELDVKRLMEPWPAEWKAQQVHSIR